LTKNLFLIYIILEKFMKLPLVEVYKDFKIPSEDKSVETKPL